MNHDDVIDAIKAQLVATNLSAAEISRRATGQKDALKRLFRGHKPSAERLANLCDALGLEFYVGPRRDEGALIEKISRALDFPEPTEVEAIIEKIESLNRWDPETLAKHLNDAEAALEKWRSEGLDTIAEIAKQMQANPGISVARAAQAIRARRGELTDDEALAQPEDTSARPVMVMELAAAAGGGAEVLDERTREPVYFRRGWLDKHALDPTQCRVIGVMSDSMEPTLPEGCKILVDFKRRRRLADHIFVIRTVDGVVVKRLARDGRDDWILVSDNDSPDWPDVPWPDEAELVGEVKWMARTF